MFYLKTTTHAIIYHNHGDGGDALSRMFSHYECMPVLKQIDCQQKEKVL